MRVSKRAQEVSVAQTELQLTIMDYWQENKIDYYEEQLRALTFEMREILLDMEPKVERAERFSALKDLIRNFQKEKELTDVEVLQALTSEMAGSLKYMLRYERHGNFDKPAMEA